MGRVPGCFGDPRAKDLKLFHSRRPIHFVNAHVVGENGVFASSLRVEKSRITGFNENSQNDFQIDLHGAYIFPGLINSHDHLEHNHYGRVKFREKYTNASVWVEDMNPHLQSDPQLVDGKLKPLADKLFIGGIKNLLSGVTTVAHHNPFYDQFRNAFPVRVLRDYGWAHSLYLQKGKAGANGEVGGSVLKRYQSTPTNFPFIMHLAEGVDESARHELQELDFLGVLGPNVILVHGVGLSIDQWIYLTQKGAGLIWCPASNIFLLEKTISVQEFLDSTGSTRLVLGTDSRLTGSRDLLDEMKFAKEVGNVSPHEIFSMVTQYASNLLRLPRAGRLAVDFPADLLIVPNLRTDPFEALLACKRNQILLVMINGQPVYGAVEMLNVFRACSTKTSHIRLDKEEKLLAYQLAQRLQRCSIVETGIEYPVN